MSHETSDSHVRYEEQVFRATDEFPAGHDCDLTCDDVPDDESGFSSTGHYDDRREERFDPNVSETVIDLLLNSSTVKEAPGEWDNTRYLFQKELSGYWSLPESERENTTCSDCKTYEWTLVIADDGPDIDPQYALITIYSNYHGSVGTTNKYFDRLQERKEESK